MIIFDIVEQPEGRYYRATLTSTPVLNARGQWCAQYPSDVQARGYWMRTQDGALRSLLDALQTYPGRLLHSVQHAQTIHDTPPADFPAEG